MSSKEYDKERVMHSKIDNKEIMINKAGEVIEKPFQSLLSRYPIGWETSGK